MNDNQQLKNIGHLIFLHLFPGLLTVLCQLLLIRSGLLRGMPNVFILATAGIIGIIGWEGGYLCYQSKKETGSWNFLKIMGFRTEKRNKKLIVYGVGLFMFLGICFTIFKPLSILLLDTIFNFMPAEFQLNQSLTGYSKPVIIAVLFVYIFVFAVLYPIIEEFYFRGFLLNRMKWLGNRGIVLNTVLFACYHFWSPWLIITRIIGLLPLYYTVSKKHSLKLGIIVHCLANTTDIFPILSLLGRV
ncbi:CPBP family intramembrane glutamic endopeptidase [Enterococcus sp. LJL128]